MAAFTLYNLLGVVIVITFLIVFLLHFREEGTISNPGKYLTPSAKKAWREFQEERRKTHEHREVYSKLAVDHRLGPWLFYSVPFLFAIILHVLMPEVEPPLTISVIFSLLLLALGLVSLQQKRIIDDTPTLKAMGVFIGQAELKGTAESENPLTSYITGTKCVYYSWSIMELHPTAGWTNISSGKKASTFYLKDDTGAVRIDPENALVLCDEVLNSNVDQNDPLYLEEGLPVGINESRRHRLFKETLIPLHAPLYVIGQARERKDKVAVEIAYDEDEPLYVISTRGEKRVSSEYWNRFLILAVIGFIISIVFPRLSEMGRIFDPLSFAPLTLTELNPLIGFIPGVIFMVTLILGWWLVVYNSLVNLRNDVDRAWSTIDVQLNRRSDLIPNLVEIIEGYKEHEEYIQSQIATLRAQSMNPETPIGVASLIHSIAEAYPELKAGQQFLELQQALEDTEQRIALARGYYNEQTRFYNTRLEVIPDTFVAQLGGLQPRQYWEAENFQRAQETIEFVS